MVDKAKDLHPLRSVQVSVKVMKGEVTLQSREDRAVSSTHWNSRQWVGGHGAREGQPKPVASAAERARVCARVYLESPVRRQTPRQLEWTRYRSSALVQGRSLSDSLPRRETLGSWETVLVIANGQETGGCWRLAGRGRGSYSTLQGTGRLPPRLPPSAGSAGGDKPWVGSYEPALPHSPRGQLTVLSPKPGFRRIPM